jgi:hypothetical protein
MRKTELKNKQKVKNEKWQKAKDFKRFQRPRRREKCPRMSKIFKLSER